MRKTGKNESGQAIAELVAGLIALMAVFLGVMFMAGMGIENIRAVMTARADADQAAAEGGGVGAAGRNVRSWDYGRDQLYFTSDDSADTTSFDEPALYRSQLVTKDGTMDAGNPIPLSTGNLSTTFSNLPGYNILSSCANLVSSTHTVSDPLANRSLQDMRPALRLFLGVRDDFSITETISMPRMTDTE
jgi:hypothetical protein